MQSKHQMESRLEVDLNYVSIAQNKLPGCRIDDYLAKICQKIEITKNDYTII